MHALRDGPGSALRAVRDDNCGFEIHHPSISFTASSSVMRALTASPLADAEGKDLVGPRRAFERVAGLVEEVRDVDRGERIGAFDHEHVSLGHGGQRLARPQCGQRAFQATQIDGPVRHVDLCRHYSTFTLASRMILPHFTVSSRMRSAKTSGGLAIE